MAHLILHGTLYGGSNIVMEYLWRIIWWNGNIAMAEHRMEIGTDHRMEQRLSRLGTNCRHRRNCTLEQIVEERQALDGLQAQEESQGHLALQSQ